MPRPLRVALAITGLLLAANLLAAVLVSFGVGDPNVLELARRILMWGIVTPIVVALVVLGAHRFTVGRWHLAGATLCVLGDGLGATTGSTLVLLGCFLLGHLCYLAALWPTRRRSLAWTPAALGYAIVALIAAGITAASAGPLAVPVIAYALVLTAMAAFAALDAVGLLGGLLFMVSDLVLGMALFVLEIPDPLRSIVVLVAYAGAQALLAISLQRRLRLGDPSAAPASGRGSDRTGPGSTTASTTTA